MDNTYLLSLRYKLGVNDWLSTWKLNAHTFAVNSVGGFGILRVDLVNMYQRPAL